MKKLYMIVALFSLLFSLTSCANQHGNRAQTGAVGGAAGGALIGQIIGHNTEATLIGAAVGTMLGYIVGNEMDKYDRQELNHVYERGVSGQTAAWINPDNGNQYQVTPQPAYTTATNPQPCRKAEINAIIDGKPEKTYTTACRDQNGQWQLHNK
ncbi:MAG: glycine zipper domain-containing protein [Desulfobulbaceae bacterium]|nr:glycine zipper domain-containing protein [Desulfobulbaceae bacterium]